MTTLFCLKEAGPAMTGFRNAFRCLVAFRFTGQARSAPPMSSVIILLYGESHFR
jgi:hypothetical protein